MSKKNNNEFTAIVVGEKVYFVTKAKAMELVDGVEPTKKEEKILDGITTESIIEAIKATGVKNPKKLDCGKLARKVLGEKKYNRLSEDVQALVRGSISAVANGMSAVNCGKDAYEGIKEAINAGVSLKDAVAGRTKLEEATELVGDLEKELKEVNTDKVKELDEIAKGKETDSDKEEPKAETKPEEASDSSDKATREEKAIKKTAQEMAKTICVDNAERVMPELLKLIDGDKMEFCKKNDLFRFVPTKGLPKAIDMSTRERAKKITNAKLKSVYDNFFDGIDAVEANNIGSKKYGKGVEKIFDACTFMDGIINDFVSEDELISYGISNPLTPAKVDGKFVMVDMFGEVVKDAE